MFIGDFKEKCGVGGGGGAGRKGKFSYFPKIVIR